MSRFSRFFLWGCGACFILLACRLPDFAANTPSETAVPIVISVAQDIAVTAEPTPTAVLFTPTMFTLTTEVSDSQPLPTPLPLLNYERDLGVIANPEQLPLLSEAERQQLLSSGLVPLNRSEPDLAAALNQQNTPLWLSASAIEQFTRLILTQADQAIEEGGAVSLQQLLARLAIGSAEQWQTAQDKNWPDRQLAAEKNWVYFTIAWQLLDPELVIPEPIAAAVQDELDLIALGGVFQSPYTDTIVDYGVFDGRSQRSGWRVSLDWLSDIPLAEFGSEQAVLLTELLQDEVTADLWQRLVAIHTSDSFEAWWDGDQPRPIYILGEVRQLAAGSAAFAGDDSDAALQISSLPGVIIVEPSDRYAAWATETRLRLLRYAEAGFLADEERIQLLELEMMLGQLSVIARKQQGGYGLTAAEREWLAQTTEKLFAAVSPYATDVQPVVVYTLYEGEQTAALGVVFGIESIGP